LRLEFSNTESRVNRQNRSLEQFLIIVNGSVLDMGNSLPFRLSPKIQQMIDVTRRAHLQSLCYPIVFSFQERNAMLRESADRMT